MRYLILFVIMLSGCASVPDGLQADGSFTYTLSAEQVAQCKREGGCSTVTGDYERQLIQEAAKHFCGVNI